MQIDEAKWNAIVVAAMAAMERLNLTARNGNRADQFSAELIKGISGNYVFLVTRHQQEGGRVARKIVAWELATGELRAARFTRNNCINVIDSDPRHWRDLKGKSPAQIVKSVGLDDYVIRLNPVDVEVVHVEQRKGQSAQPVQFPLLKMVS
jgi:hypothetical protein